MFLIRSHLPIVRLSISLVVGVYGICNVNGPAWAQPVETGVQQYRAAISGTAGEKLPVVNGFGEKLKPIATRRASAPSQPYQPFPMMTARDDDKAQLAEVEMFVGESRVFPTPGVGRIAVGNGGILTAAALDNKEVILFANAVGTSSVFIWNADGRYQRIKVSIVSGDTTRYSREIAAFLSGVPNAKTTIVGDKVIVEGDNLSDLDLSKIDELSKRYPQIVNFTNRLGWEQMILMDVKVVEFPRSELRQVGMTWNPQGGAALGAIWSPLKRSDVGGLQIGINNPPISAASGGPIPVPSSLTVLSAINLGLNAQLNLLAQDGKASILSEPQLSARNGSKASFLVGGEYPYTVSSVNGPSVFFKPYGIKLDIQPRVDRNGVVRATIESEVSAIDASVVTPTGPGLTTRKTSTEFNVQSGETLVLSGLISRNTANSIDKVPGLGDVPVLGALFRSRRFQDNETELVIFVTPSVVSSKSAGLVERVERTRETLERNLGKPPYLTDPLQPGHNPELANERTSSIAPIVSGERNAAVR